MFAHAEAIRLHEQALLIVRDLPEGRDRDRQELAVLEGLAAPLNARYGYSFPELQRTLERSIVLAETLGHKDSMLTGLVGLWASRFVQGRTADGYQSAGQGIRCAAAGGPAADAVHRAACHVNQNNQPASKPSS